MKHDKRTITAMMTGVVIGAALVGGATAGIVVEPTWQKIYVDGRQVSMTAYNIAGSNYVRHRNVLPTCTPSTIAERNVRPWRRLDIHTASVPI